MPNKLLSINGITGIDVLFASIPVILLSGKSWLKWHVSAR
jgi:hypothetical protein